MTNKPNPISLRMAYLIDTPFSQSKLDPAKIELVKQANLVRALYSRLVEFDLDGSLRPSLATSFTVEHDLITFKIKPQIKTQSGNTISSKDVAYSLKRLLILKINKHSSLEMYLCGSPIHFMSDNCEGIQWNESELRLKVKKPEFAKFLLPILANVDFSIIPLESVNWTDKNLPITNYQNTSGVFYVAKDLEDGKATLKKNKTHPYATAQIPDVIELINTDFKDIQANYSAGKVDLIPTIYQFTSSFIDEVKKEDGYIHETLPVNIWFINNFDNAYLDFTKEELLYIASIIKSNIPIEGFNYKFKPSSFLFPPSSAGELTNSQSELVTAIWNNVKNKPINKKYKIWVPIAKLELFKNAFQAYSFIDVYNDNGLPLLKQKNEQPHAMIISMDSTFFEDLSMLSYNFNMGTFGFSKDKADAWVEKYIQTDEKENRIKQLRELHLSLLLDLKIIPLGFSPYIAIARHGWIINFSKYYAGSPLWRIQRQ